MTLFTDKVGKTRFMRILEFFITWRGMAYTEKEISSDFKYSSESISATITRLVKLGYVINSGSFYQLNEKNPYAKCFIKIFDTGISDDLKRKSK